MNRIAPIVLAVVGAVLLPPTTRADDLPPPPAQAREPKCPEEAQPLPPDLAAWAKRDARIAAVATAERLGDAVVPVGRAVEVDLLPTPSVSFVIRPANPGGSVARGGMFRLEIAKAATYHVAVGARSWLDVVVAGKAAEAVAHGGGPACAGIRKVVDYDLPIGTHVLMVAASDAAVTTLLVAEKQ